MKLFIPNEALHLFVARIYAYIEGRKVVENRMVWYSLERFELCLEIYDGRYGFHISKHQIKYACILDHAMLYVYNFVRMRPRRGYIQLSTLAKVPKW